MTKLFPSFLSTEYESLEITERWNSLIDIMNFLQSEYDNENWFTTMEHLQRQGVFDTDGQHPFFKSLCKIVSKIYNVHLENLTPQDMARVERVYACKGEELECCNVKTQMDIIQYLLNEGESIDQELSYLDYDMEELKNYSTLETWKIENIQQRYQRIISRQKETGFDLTPEMIEHNALETTMAVMEMDLGFLAYALCHQDDGVESKKEFINAIMGTVKICFEEACFHVQSMFVETEQNMRTQTGMTQVLH